ncbi:MAG: ABC transporter permease [Acidobacteriia bacterium]|nr:ABC transporter permease [Terriglobia bacterium]
MWHDLKYALRMLRRSPGFTVVAILTLALGIGANSAIFSVTSSVLLSSLPVAEAWRLMQVQTADRNNPNNLTAISLPNFEDLRAQNHVFSGMVATVAATVTLSGRGDPLPLPVQLATANYFDTLGVKAARGRTFLPDEDRIVGGNPVAVLSHAMWVDHFGADPAIVGRTINLNLSPFTVIGVTPPEFKGIVTVGNPEIIWIPMSMHSQALSGTIETNFNNRRLRTFRIFGRLNPGSSLEAADAEMKVIAARLEKQYPFENNGHTLAVSPLSDAYMAGVGARNQLAAAALALSAVAGVVLLIACFNLANILMARASRRAREMSIRAALGAENSRLIRQLLTENLLIALCGGAGGFLTAIWGRQALWSLRPPFLPGNAVDLRLDPKMVVFTAAATLVTGLVFGLMPALRASSADLNEILKSGSRGNTAHTGAGLRGALVISQFALTVIALAGAGLFIRSMQSAQRIDPGFETRKLFSFGVDLASLRWTADRGIAFQNALLDRVRSIPGVEAAALASSAPFATGVSRTILKQGQESEAHALGIGMAVNHVSPGYFDTLRIPLRAGRFVTELDRADTVKVVVINEAVANLFWPGEDAVGKKLYYLSDPVIRQVIGVVGNTVVLNFGETPRPVLYIPLTQNYQPYVAIDVRAKGAPEPVLAAALAEVQRMNGSIAPLAARTIQQQIGEGLWAPRIGAALFGIFGLLGLLLAAVGIYGVMAYMVNERTNEIGIRMALGARPGTVLAMVILQSLRLALTGVGLGLAGAFLLARSTRALLFQISPTDPVTFASVGFILLAVAAAAGCVSGLRAARLDPLLALREVG